MARIKGSIDHQYRREAMKQLFGEQVREFHGDNDATQVATFLEDAIRAMSHSIRQSDSVQWEALFRAAMHDAGIKETA